MEIKRIKTIMFKGKSTAFLSLGKVGVCLGKLSEITLVFVRSKYQVGQTDVQGRRGRHESGRADFQSTAHGAVKRASRWLKSDGQG